MIKDNISHWEKIENLERALKAAQNLEKVSIINIGAKDIQEGKVIPILGLLWQLIRVRTNGITPFLYFERYVGMERKKEEDENICGRIYSHLLVFLPSFSSLPSLMDQLNRCSLTCCPKWSFFPIKSTWSLWKVFQIVLIRSKFFCGGLIITFHKLVIQEK